MRSTMGNKERRGTLKVLEKAYFEYKTSFPGIEGEWYAKGRVHNDW